MMIMVVEEKLLKWLKIENDPRLIFTIRTLVSSMESTCKRCMKERDINIFEPLCEERGYLNLLIEAGVSQEYLPRFCYKRRGIEIVRFLNKKPNPLPVRDANYYLPDFIKLFAKNLLNLYKKGKYEELVKALGSILEERWGSVRYFKMSRGIFCLILGDFDSLLIIDPTRNIVRVNVENIYVFSDRDYIEFVSKLFGFLQDTKFEIIDLIENEILLRVDLMLQENIPEESLERFKELGLLSVRKDDGKMSLIIKLLDPLEARPPFDISNPLRIVKLLSRIMEERKA